MYIRVAAFPVSIYEHFHFFVELIYKMLCGLEIVSTHMYSRFVFQRFLENGQAAGGTNT